MSNNYIIPAYGPNGALTVVAGALDTTSTALTLVGRGGPGYGQAFAINTVRQLSNFANTTAPAGTPLVGQLWFDTGVSALKVWSNGAWKVIFGESSNSTVLVPPVQGGLGLKPVPADANKFIQVLPDGSGYKFVTLAEMLAALEGAGLATNYLKSNANTGPTTNNAFDLGSTTRRFATVYATTFNGVATSARFADLAERYETSEPVEPGDVVELGGDKEIQKVRDCRSEQVFGVISTAPGFKMNADAGTDETHPYVALVGRVPVKVKGAVKKGERLVASGERGVAIAESRVSGELTTFQIIGRSLVNKESHDVELIEVALGAK